MPWIYPLVCTAAHTGTRRSELLRIQIPDIDFDRNAILIHEKKRAKGKRTSRRVTITPILRQVLNDWLSVYPGGPWLFAQASAVFRSKSKRSAPTQVDARDECHDHFKRTLAGGKWKVLRGIHLLRHSFISCSRGGWDGPADHRRVRRTSDGRATQAAVSAPLSRCRERGCLSRVWSGGSGRMSGSWTATVCLKGQTWFAVYNLLFTGIRSARDARIPLHRYFVSVSCFPFVLTFFRPRKR